MAPNQSDAIGYPFLDTNRHSPRIFNKNLMKFDVSMANDKIGFMRSLNLVCVNNTKEFQSKVNWDVLSPGTVLPLKECSVVLTGVNCNSNGELLSNKTDLVHHKNLHCKLNANECKDIFQKEQIIKTNSTQSIDANIPNSINKIGPVKSNAPKRNSNNGVTLKVTLKIGDEVISKKYCKKKYLNKESSSNRIHHDADCEQCSDIKGRLRNSTVISNVTNSEVCIEKSDAESLIQTVSEDKWLMAAALVEFELQRQRLQSVKSHIFECKKQSDDEVHEKKYGSDTLVPEKSKMMSSNPFNEYHVQELSQITRNPKKLYNNSTNTCQPKRLTTEKNYEIITIDDDVCNDLIDDCVIVGESFSHVNLEDKENSYDFHVTGTNKSVSKMHSITESQRNCFDDGRPIKRRKLNNLDSPIFVIDRKKNINLQSSLSKSYEKSILNFNQVACH